MRNNDECPHSWEPPVVIHSVCVPLPAKQRRTRMESSSICTIRTPRLRAEVQDVPASRRPVSLFSLFTFSSVRASPDPGSWYELLLKTVAPGPPAASINLVS